MARYVTFADLLEGERFQFVYGLRGDRVSPDTFVKGRAGWYRVIGPTRTGRRNYRTGKKTAVTRA